MAIMGISIKRRSGQKNQTKLIVVFGLRGSLSLLYHGSSNDRISSHDTYFWENRKIGIVWVRWKRIASNNNKKRCDIRMCFVFVGWFGAKLLCTHIFSNGFYYEEELHKKQNTTTTRTWELRGVFCFWDGGAIFGISNIQTHTRTHRASCVLMKFFCIWCVCDCTWVTLSMRWDTISIPYSDWLKFGHRISSSQCAQYMWVPKLCARHTAQVSHFALC